MQVELVHLDNKPIVLADNGSGGLLQVELEQIELATPPPVSLNGKRKSTRRSLAPSFNGGAEVKPAAVASTSSAAFPSDGRVRPLGALADAPIERHVWSHQQEKLDEARRLVAELRDRRASLSPSEVISCAVRPQGEEHPCDVGFELSYYDSWHALVGLRVSNCDLGLRTFLGMLRDPDLIHFPKVPGLPVLESIELPHTFAPNDLVYRVNISPWGPIPGLVDINNAYLYDVLDEDGSILIFAQSPPEGATHHRGWPLPPLGKHRKRNVISGLALVATPTRGQHAHARVKQTDGAAALPICRSSGCPYVGRLATGGYCCERCRSRPCEHGAHCSAWLARCGSLDIDVCCRVKLPVPSWLLPPPLIRWLVPKLASRVFWPQLVELSATFDESPFGARYRADASGFYRACAARLPLELPLDGAADGYATTCHACANTAAAAASLDDDLMGARSPSSEFDELTADCRGAAVSAERLAATSAVHDAAQVEAEQPTLGATQLIFANGDADEDALCRERAATEERTATEAADAPRRRPSGPIRLLQ